MSDYSLVPVDHQPDFGGVSLVPVDHNPFDEQAPAQMAALPAPPPAQSLMDWSGVGTAMPESYGASVPIMDPLANAALGAGRAAISGATLPGDVMAGKASPDDIGRVMDLASLMTLGAGAAPAEANSMRMGIKAYHGSPHDFDAFDLSKIGTGEGAQAYGHGLYFADQEATAKAYRDQLSYMNKSLDGQRFYGNESPAHSFLSDALDAGTGVDGAIAKAQQTYDDFAKGPNASYRNAAATKDALDTLKQWKSSADIKSDPGHMYQVDINADPEHFLDWDKPLSEQHPQTQDAVKQAMGPNWDQFKFAKAGDAVKQGFIAPGVESTASKLHEAGIPGIKYLDQGSRAAGEGSRNYVVFDHNLIDIVKKYAVAGIALPPAVSAYLADRNQSNDEPNL